MADDTLAIGDRRWLVWLGRRTESNDPNGSGLIYSYDRIAQVWAAIQPIGALTYYESIQTYQPISHRIVVRWRPDVRLFDCIVRDTNLPNGDVMQEVYMIKRSNDYLGRKRYLVIEARLEGRDL